MPRPEARRRTPRALTSNEGSRRRRVFANEARPPTTADDQAVVAALEGLPIRDRPSWLIQYLIDINNLPVGPLPPRRKRRSLVLMQGSGAVAAGSPSANDETPPSGLDEADAPPLALTMQTPTRPAESAAPAVAAAPSAAPRAPDTDGATTQGVASRAPRVTEGPGASPRTADVQQYRQEALQLLAQLGCGPPAAREEPPDPPDLLQLPPGFSIAECSWNDWRVRELNLQFAAEDERIGTLDGPPPRGFRFAVLTERTATGEVPVGYVLWRGGLAHASDSTQLQLESAPQIMHFFIDAGYRGHRRWRLGQRLLTWWRSAHALHAFVVVEPNDSMHGMLRRNGCASQTERQGVERSALFTCYPVH